MEPNTRESLERPGIKQRVAKALPVLTAIGQVLWKRRLKLLGLLALYAMGRSCQFLPEAMAPLCEAIVRALRSVP